MELGGNIELEGFDDLDNAKLVVVKKIVGHAVKDIAGEFSDFSGIKLIFDDNEPKFGMIAEVSKGGTIITSTENGSNLFFVLDAVLKKITKKLKE